MSSNIFIDDDGLPLFAEFATKPVSQVKHENSYWCAPELFTSNIPTKASDVYAFGILLCELLFASIPCFLQTVDRIDAKLSDPQFLLKIPSETPPMLKCLFNATLSQNPSKRPSFKQIYSLLKHQHAAFPETDKNIVRDFVAATTNTAAL
jgi:serine/threonine protein kinase